MPLGVHQERSVHRRALARARLGEIKPLGPKSRPVGGEVESSSAPSSEWGYGCQVGPALSLRFVWRGDQPL